MQLISSPIIGIEGAIYSFELGMSHWNSWIRSMLIQNGNTANLVGKIWEGYLAYTLKKKPIDEVYFGVELTNGLRKITDIDLLVRVGSLLLIIQVKIYYGNGISQYDQWKHKQKLIAGVDQALVAHNYIIENKGWLTEKMEDSALVKTIKPVVLTNNHLFNGWKYDGVSIMSTGSLMQILNGVNVKFQTDDGEILGEKKYIKGECASEVEFLSLIEEPLDWRIGDTKDVIKYHEEVFQYSTLKFPLYDVESI